MSHQAGDRVICRESYGYMFTRGKQYDVVSYHPITWADNGFRYSAAMSVVDDGGNLVRCHPCRFVKPQEYAHSQ